MSYTTTHEEPLAISITQVAKRYGVPRKWVKMLVQSGKLQSIQMDGRTKILEADLEHFFADRLRAMGIGPPLILDRKDVN